MTGLGQEAGRRGGEEGEGKPARDGTADKEDMGIHRG
jgi:hypothetical protein